MEVGNDLCCWEIEKKSPENIPLSVYVLKLSPPSTFPGTCKWEQKENFLPETGAIFRHLECLDVCIFFLAKLLFIQGPRKIPNTKIQSSSWLGASCSLEKHFSGACSSAVTPSHLVLVWAGALRHRSFHLTPFLSMWLHVELFPPRWGDRVAMSLSPSPAFCHLHGNSLHSTAQVTQSHFLAVYYNREVTFPPPSSNNIWFFFFFLVWTLLSC